MRPGRSGQTGSFKAVLATVNASLIERLSLTATDVLLRRAISASNCNDWTSPNGTAATGSALFPSYWTRAEQDLPCQASSRLFCLRDPPAR